MEDMYQKLQQLQKAKELLSFYHGSTQLQNIPEFASSELYNDLANRKIKLPLDKTVANTIKEINETFNIDSIMLQFRKFQQESMTENIFRSDQSPENQRLDFMKSGNVHDMLQMIFSPELYYFTINGRKMFRKNDRKHNRWVYKNAMDTTVIEPQRVPESSLRTLGIQLDPDCKNLKEIFKAMRPLSYTKNDEQKYATGIYNYRGKYIVLAGQRIIYPTNEPVTQGEKRKEDAQGHMSVYPDIFSIIRREEYIVEYAWEKQKEYTDIKWELLRSIKEIERNKKEYPIRVQHNVKKIIEEIDEATSAQIMAAKLHQLYKVSGWHSLHDKQHLEASMRKFTQRIMQLMWISTNTQLHLLELNDTYENQRLDLQLFHAQISMSIAETSLQQKENIFLLAFQNYFRARKDRLQEPFLTFDAQIQRAFGSSYLEVKKNLKANMLKSESIIPLQEKSLAGYILEHELNLEEKTLEDVAYELGDIQPGFDVDMNKKERDIFFDQLKDLEKIDHEIIKQEIKNK